MPILDRIGIRKSFRIEVESWCHDECTARHLSERLTQLVIDKLNRVLDTRERTPYWEMQPPELTVNTVWPLYLQKVVDDNVTPDEKIGMMSDRDLLEALYRKLVL